MEEPHDGFPGGLEAFGRGGAGEEGAEGGAWAKGADGVPPVGGVRLPCLLTGTCRRR